jgi:hypothetical protein
MGSVDSSASIRTSASPGPKSVTSGNADALTGRRISTQFNLWIGQTDAQFTSHPKLFHHRWRNDNLSGQGREDVQNPELMEILER